MAAHFSVLAGEAIGPTAQNDGPPGPLRHGAIVVECRVLGVAIDPASCINYDAACYGWSDYHGTTLEKKQVNAEFFQYLTGSSARGNLAIWGYNYDGVLCGGNDNWWGRALTCYARYLTEDQMASHVWMDRPIEDYTSQSFSSITTITAPEMPVWGSGDWELVRGKVKSDPNLEDAINHKLDPYSAADPFRGDGGDSGIPTTATGNRCEWDKESEAGGSVHPGHLTWAQMLSYASETERGYYEDECEEAWLVFEQSGGTAQRGLPLVNTQESYIVHDFKLKLLSFFAP